LTATKERVGFGGGCHWCTEAVFQALRGVYHVAQGFLRSTPPHNSWSEAVEVTFDPEVIPLDTLVEIHLSTHASTSAHKMRGKYRSAVYAFDKDQFDTLREILRAQQPELDALLQTRVLTHADFRLSEPRFQNYFTTNPDRPFCRTYIEPKLRMLRERFSEFAPVRSEVR